MTELPQTSRVVIIGGGAVGASCLFHLAQAGWSDLILLEKNQLTAGSTWHAAGNVPTFSPSWSIMNIQRYSAELYRRLGSQVDYPMNYHVTGSIRLAHTTNRMMEFSRACGMGRHQGMHLEILDLSEIKHRYPFIETHDLKGALYDPNDGDIDPAQLTQAFAKGARDLGAKIFQNTDVIGVGRVNGEWVVHTNEGSIKCEIVVNAAGYYAQKVGDFFVPFGGRKVPMAVMSHQYLLTEEIPELAQWSSEEKKKLPLLRDVDTSYYLRQEKNGLNLGPYEANCKAHWVESSDPMPDDFSFQLYESDLDRLEHYIDDACSRVPILAKGGISNVINGPIPYTPDGNPLIGPMPGVENAFEACVFTFGIAQAGGAGKVLAEWVVEGQTEWDMWSCDPRRFTQFADKDYCVAKAIDVYGNEYAIHYPFHEWPQGRNKKLSPNHDRLLHLGGQMGVYNGWERANWFANGSNTLPETSTLTWERNGPWEPFLQRECLAVHNAVGVLDLPGFSRYHLNGDGAGKWLESQIIGLLPKIGRMNLAYFANEKGRVVTEMSIMRHDVDSFTLITAAIAQWHDLAVLKSNLPRHLTLQDASNSTSTLIIAGPNSRALLSRISDGDFERPWLSIQNAKVADEDVLLARVSYTGELGWEVHADNDNIHVIYEALLDQGAQPFGMYALNSLRVEKGYRSWKGDLSTDYSVLESGLDSFLKLNKESSFPGKKALLIEKQQPRKRHFVILSIDQDRYETPYMSTVWHNGKIVGETTSGAWGYRVNKNLALAIINYDLIQPNTRVDVEIFGHLYSAQVESHKALFDPENNRLKS